MSALYRCFLGFGVLAGLSIASGSAIANCGYSVNMNKGARTFNVSEAITALRTAKVGETIVSSGVIKFASYPFWIGQCSATATGVRAVLSPLRGTLVAGLSPPTYSTNIDGIGYRVKISGSNIDLNDTYTGNWPTNTSSVYNGWTGVIIDLVKTAPVVGNGMIATGEYARFHIRENPAQQWFTANIGTVRILAPTCQITTATKNQTVSLGDVRMNRFSGVSSTAAERTFNIGVTCDVSATQQGNAVSLILDGTADPSNKPGVLQLSSDTDKVAVGVGIQILDGKTNTPVKFGEPVAIGNSAAGTIDMPFKARYYQTAKDIIPGQADGMVTLTLSYK
ncbi:fimbrial protein [Variovorax sp.]|jgi:type 1 fimbria pilin|uniref:fimbrial protein n=1 Tax=Variovorax sp. TaxID=1871043 RepID=UPI0037D9F7AE